MTKSGAWRSGSWLTEGRLLLYPLVLIGGYILTFIAWLWYSQHSQDDPTCLPLGADFLGFWSASWLELHQGPATVYNADALETARAMAVGCKAPVLTWLYPPTAGLLILPLALLPYMVALLLWGGSQLALAVTILRRILPHPSTLLLSLAFPGTFLTLLTGQNALLSTALLGGGLLWLERRPKLAGLCFAGLLYKPHLGLLIPIALIAGRYWRVVIATTLAAGLYLGLTVLVLSPESWAVFFDHSAFARQILEQGRVDWGKLASIYAGLRLLGVSSLPAWISQAAIGLFTASLIAMLWANRDTPFAIKAAGLAAATALATPFLLDYDLTILALAIAWLAKEGLRSGFRPWEASLLAVSWLMPLVIRPLGVSCGIPLAPLMAGLLLGLVWQRTTAAAQWRPTTEPPA